MKIGRKKRQPGAATGAPPAGGSLASLSVASGSAGSGRPSVRRRVEFVPYERLVIPSTAIDLTELLLRQGGEFGQERFLLWAGTIAGRTAFVSSVVQLKEGDGSGFITPEGSAEAHEALATRDLVPLAQIHSHPDRAFLSRIDRENPFFMSRGFLSIVIPNFGFVDMNSLDTWKVFRFESVRVWTELTSDQVKSLAVIDDGIIVT